MSICIQVECSDWDGLTEAPDLKLQALRTPADPQGATVPARGPGLGSYFIARAPGPLGFIDLNRWISNTPELALEEGRAIDDWQIVQAVWTPAPSAPAATDARIFCVSRGPNPFAPTEFQVAFDSRAFVDAADPLNANIVQKCWPLWTGTALGIRSDQGTAVPPEFNSIVFNLVKVRAIADPCPTPSAELPFLPPVIPALS